MGLVKRRWRHSVYSMQCCTLQANSTCYGTQPLPRSFWLSRFIARPPLPRLPINGSPTSQHGTPSCQLVTKCCFTSVPSTLLPLSQAFYGLLLPLPLESYFRYPPPLCSQLTVALSPHPLLVCFQITPVSAGFVVVIASTTLPPPSSLTRDRSHSGLFIGFMVVLSCIPPSRQPVLLLGFSCSLIPTSSLWIGFGLLGG